MARTKRGIAYKHYWGYSKQELKKRIDDAKCRFEDEGWGKRYIDHLERDYKLFGTESRNWSPSTHYHFNRVHRIGRRIERDQLRSHLVQDDEYYDFNDSRYRARYKGVWWDIY
jgi:hypothetical protein